MSNFVAPVEDILFTLEHVAGAPALPDWDSELVREIVQHFASFAEGEIAPVDEIGDLQGARFEAGRVHLPEAFLQVYQSYIEQGWHGLSLPERFDGQEMSAPVLGAISEIFSGACHALQMIVGLVAGAARTLLEFGTQEQIETYLPMLASGDWLATMCLTEAGAGSDLSGIRTRAVECDGNWRIDGEKIFISGGDQDASPYILHLVLARTGTLEEATKGLSLFLCRSHNEDGSRNGVKVERIEEKMGLHASPTCQLSFTDAHAELIGKPGEGLKAMFTLMNHTRLDVGFQGVAHAARASSISRLYAAERQQGRLPGGREKVAIARHSEVARMLNEQDARALGGRAMCQIATVMLEAGDNPDLVDFLTPVCKVFCSEAGIAAADMGIQVLGGYGYLHEYRVEQTLRDARITAIYEGTNAIQSLTLATRLLRYNDGKAADAFAEMIEGVIAANTDSGQLAESFVLWQDLRATLLISDRPGDLATAFMNLAGLVAYQAVWLKIAAAADESNDAPRLRALADYVQRTAPVEARYWSQMAQV